MFLIFKIGKPKDNWSQTEVKSLAWSRLTAKNLAVPKVTQTSYLLISFKLIFEIQMQNVCGYRVTVKMEL